MSATPNVDPAELEKFSELAHRWWDPASEFRPLHEINPLRLEWIDRHARLSGKAVLDVYEGMPHIFQMHYSRPEAKTSISMSRSIGKLPVAPSSMTASANTRRAPAGACALTFFRIAMESSSDQSWITVIIT